MKLKVKFLKWSAGVPVVMLNEKTAEKLGIHSKDRVFIKFDSKKFSTIIDTIKEIVKEDEIAISSELKTILDLKSDENVELSLATTPKSLAYIKEKLSGKHLSEEEINDIIKDIVNNSLSEAEIALFISAMYQQGTSMQETIYLTKAILKTGNILKLNGKSIVDKHSIGGIAGRTTPIIVSICASEGLTMPKTSSRAITSPAGTADAIETIAKIDFSISELKKIIRKTNACIVWGGELGLAPADSKIIQIETMINIDSQAQLLASIMAKKLSVGSKYILIHIPYGKTAKVNKEEALKLKKKFEYLGKYFKRKLKVILTETKGPFGNGVGPVLELIDVINILDPKKTGPKKLEKISLFLSSVLLEMSGKVKKGEGLKAARGILESGQAFEKFREIIKAQKGSLNFNKLKPAKYKKDIFSGKSGKVIEIDNKKINNLARIAGCPVDKFSGVYIYKLAGEKIHKKDKLLTVYSESKSRLKEAVDFCKKEKPILIK